VKVFVFSSRDSVHYDGARTLAHDIGAAFVNRLSFEVEDLKLIVRFGIVEPVVIVAIGDAGEIVLRIPRLVTREALVRDLQGLT
jgi:hypothetical protein